jgi:hypothetical protein
MSVATERTCQLVGCEQSLEGMRKGARFCCPAHGAMARREKPYLIGTCELCGTRLASTRGRFCSATCRSRAWREQQKEASERFRRVLAAFKGDVKESCLCGGTGAYTDEYGDRFCISCSRPVAA